MHPLSSAPVDSAWTFGASILTFAFPMLLFIAVGGALWILYTKPELVPGRWAGNIERPVSATVLPRQPAAAAGQAVAPEDHATATGAGAAVTPEEDSGAAATEASGAAATEASGAAAAEASGAAAAEAGDADATRDGDADAIGDGGAAATEAGA